MRKSNLFIACLAVQFLLFGLLFAHSAYREKADEAYLSENRELVRRLHLTDLCLVTEASYTRHVSQADLHRPFQDHPFSQEHFPTGSIVRAPDLLKRINGKLD